MLKRNITYTDYHGNQRTEEFYFNLSKFELSRMEVSTKGGLAEQLKAIVASGNGGEIMDYFTEIISKSYGVRTDDGRNFRKSAELSEAFLQSAAFEALFEELVTDANAAAIFVNAIIPKELSDANTAQATHGAPQDYLPSARNQFQQAQQPQNMAPNPSPMPQQAPAPQGYIQNQEPPRPGGPTEIGQYPPATGTWQPDPQQ